MLNNKKIAMIIAFQDFRDEELFIPKSVFEGQGIEVKIFSSKKGEALGSYGGTIKVDLLLENLNMIDFDSVFFVGGSGALDYLENKDALEIARKAVSENKILGAICAAPTILAKSGVLKNKKATVWTSQLDKSLVKMLKSGGAEYLENPVVIDGNIITANGPESARKFAETIVMALQRN